MNPDVDLDEMVTVVLGAGTENQIAYRCPRYMVFDVRPVSAFCDKKVDE